jgi:Tfp pilus assembly protein PilP
MMRRFLGLAAILAMVGCETDDRGDVAAAEKAARNAPTSVDQLPPDMPPEARRQAEAAMKQREAMQQHMDQQAEAMKKAMEANRR